jgi:hypothetical protein
MVAAASSAGGDDYIIRCCPREITLLQILLVSEIYIPNYAGSIINQ